MSDFKVKMHQIQFRLGLCPRPRWGSLQLSPNLLAGFMGRTSKGKGDGDGRKRRGREGIGGEKEGEGDGEEWTTPQILNWLPACVYDVVGLLLRVGLYSIH